MIRYILALYFLLCLCSCYYEPPPTCLLEGTRILTPQGTKLIENLSVGDKIISYDGNNKITNKIVAIKKSYTKETIKISLNNGIEIEGTEEHPFFNVEKQDYIKIGKLKRGDLLQLANGRSSKIASVKKKS